MKGIGFSNMKALKEEQWFDFKAITLLTGTNNSGKSSIINAMQMLQDNLTAKNIDELLKTKFTVKSRQDKHGSIASFINNSNPERLDNFTFFMAKANIRYGITLKITEGLETYGMVKQIVAKCMQTNRHIFLVNVINGEPEFNFQVNVNYQYFIDRWYKKYENTVKLKEYIKELDALKVQVDEGKIDYKFFQSFAKKIENEVSVYIDTWPPGHEAFSIELEKSVEGPCSYHIDYSHDSMTGRDYLDEICVITESKKELLAKEFEINKTVLVSEEKLNNIFKPIYEEGFFDFSFIWEHNNENKNEFQTVIKNYYNKPYNKAYRLLSDDVLTLLSHCVWVNLPYDGDKDPMFWSADYIKNFSRATIDFGLKSLFSNLHNGDNKSEITYDKELDFRRTFMSSAQYEELLRNNFFREVLSPLQELYTKSILDSFNKQNIADFYIKEIRDLMYKDFHIPNLVDVDINTSLYNLNFSYDFKYVSSNRFSTKRTYSFNEKTDFSNYLKQVEELRQEDKDKAIEFINKWLKVFGIADKLILTGDKETGTFKAYLKSGKTKNLLVDYGLGTNQLLPVIFALATTKRNPYDDRDNETILIEEPEANLHPALQSKLADMFADAKNNFSKRIIIETHSEYLIRKLQYLVAKSYFEMSDEKIENSDDHYILWQERRNRGYTKPDELIIYYFNADQYLTAKEPKVKKIEVTELGNLTDTFGKGFFDEATQLQFDLMQLRKEQEN